MLVRSDGVVVDCIAVSDLHRLLLTGAMAISNVSSSEATMPVNKLGITARADFGRARQ